MLAQIVTARRNRLPPRHKELTAPSPPAASARQLEQEFAVLLVASYVNDRDLADPEDRFVIVQAE